LDTLALGFVSIAGLWPHQEYAAVTSSVFGIVTVILAWAILKEPMRPAHWICVCLTFIGILALGALP
jgi:drug/metabolite transporter (DMT)-like permease